MTTTSKPHAATLPDDLLDPVDEFADEDGLNDALIELDDDGQPIVDAEDEDEDDLGEDIDALAYDAPDLDTMLKAAVGSNDGDRRCGLIAIVGRPNVGKSTLLNTLIGQKVSITSRKAQTTRHRITGISTQADTQYVFVDTPGFQTTHTTRGTAALNRNLNKTVQSVLGDVDVVLFVVDAAASTRPMPRCCR